MPYVDREQGQITGVFRRMQRSGQEHVASDDPDLLAYLDGQEQAAQAESSIRTRMEELRAKREAGQTLTAAEKDELLDLLLGIAPSP